MFTELSKFTLPSNHHFNYHIIIMTSFANQHCAHQRFPTLESMCPLFRDLESRKQTILSRHLDVDKTARIHHSYLSHEAFESKYATFYGSLPNERVHESSSYDPTNLYYSSNVCFMKKERYSSPGHLYSEPKNNTYTLCPICDPFKNSHLPPIMKEKVRDGKKILIDQNEPQFYDTLHSEYDHHMAQVHGVMKTDVTAQPFVGFSMSQLTKTQKSGVYKLTSICPYNKRGTDDPCLAEFGFNFQGKGANPYKAYFRHVHKHHFLNSKKDDDAKYQPVVCSTDGKAHHNVFIPLSEERFQRSLKHLQQSCSDSSLNPIKMCQNRNLLEKVASFVSTLEEEELDEEIKQLQIDLDNAIASLPLIDGAPQFVANTEPLKPQVVEFPQVISPPPPPGTVCPLYLQRKRSLEDCSQYMNEEPHDVQPVNMFKKPKFAPQEQIPSNPPIVPLTEEEVLGEESEDSEESEESEKSNFSDISDFYEKQEAEGYQNFVSDPAYIFEMNKGEDCQGIDPSLLLKKPEEGSQNYDTSFFGFSGSMFQ